MYDIDWAQRIYIAFCKDRTRTINIDNCIIQRIVEQSARHITRLDVQNSIIRSIVDPAKQELWKRYKRLVKGKSFDHMLLGLVSNQVCCSILDETDRQRQLLLF